MRPHESQFLDRYFQLAQTLHAAKWIDARKSGKALRVTCAHRVYALIRHFERAFDIEITCSHCNEKASLDARALHAV